MQFVAMGLVFFQFAALAEAGKFKTVCKKAACVGNDDYQDPKKPDYKGVACTNSKAPKDPSKWNVAKAKGVPTVEQIAADYELCGICTDPKNNNLFYTFGGGEEKIKKAYQKAKPDLNLKALSDCMPQVWIEAVAKVVPKMVNELSAEAQLWTARHSQAYAKVAQGDVYVLTNGIGSTEEEKATIYTVPWKNKKFPWQESHNVWYDYEFRTLQQNSKVNSIFTVQTKVDVKDMVPDRVGNGAWTRNPAHGEQAANHVDANKVTVEEIQKKMDTFNGCVTKRGEKGTKASDGAACALPSKSTSATATKTTAATRTTAAKVTKTTVAAATKTTAAKTTKTKAAKATKTKAAKATKTKAAKTTKTKKPKSSTKKKSKTARCRVGQEC